MPRLIDFQHLKASEHVHVGSVELKVGLVGANVITRRHDPFHDETKAQGVQEPEMLLVGENTWP